MNQGQFIISEPIKIQLSSQIPVQISLQPINTFDIQEWTEEALQLGINILFDKKFPFKNEKVLYTAEESKVYLLDDKYAVKEYRTEIRLPCRPCNYREYQNGVALNKYNNSHIMKTYGIVAYKDHSYIISEYIPGKTLYNLSQSINVMKLYPVLFQVILIIADLYYNHKFTHYDFHWSNILISDNNHQKHYFYNINGKEYNILSEYKIHIIDFARSHVEGVPDGYFETRGAYFKTLTPGIPDFQTDLMFFMNSFYRYVSIEHYTVSFINNYYLKVLNKLIINRLLLIDKGEQDKADKGLIMWNLQYFEQVPLIMDIRDRFWATSQSNNISIETIFDIYNKYQLGYLLIQYAPDGYYTKEQAREAMSLAKMSKKSRVYQCVNNIRHTTKKGKPLNKEPIKIPLENLEYFSVQFGESLVNDKLKTISERKYSDQELIQDIIEFFLAGSKGGNLRKITQ